LEGGRCYSEVFGSAEVNFEVPFPTFAGSEGVADSAGAGDQHKFIQGAIDLFGQRAGRNRGMAFDRRCAGNEDPLACSVFYGRGAGEARRAGSILQSDIDKRAFAQGFRCARGCFRPRRRGSQASGHHNQRQDADESFC